MTSVISLPRSDLALCEPSTHFTASTTFDLPEPFGPTTTQMPRGNSNRVRSAKLLKPESSRAFEHEKNQRLAESCRMSDVGYRRVWSGR